ncbi:MAG: TIGR00180 family glycosyltransferase, partial [Phycisphaerae bacterium]|nr:TIGR00180 family glycosyltransferase [Phycisphaerae bacterium]
MPGKPHPFSSLTLVLPTYNRPSYFARQMAYFATWDTLPALIIADSSEPTIQKANAEQLLTLCSSAQVDHRQYEQTISPSQKIADSVAQVKTDFFLMVPDDDFFFPSALEEGVSFLQTHPDYVVVHGETVTFTSDPQTGALTSVPYRQESAVESDTAVRLWRYLNNYFPIFYSIQRTEVYQRVLKKDLPPFHDLFFPELLFAIAIVLEGCVGKLTVPYSMRQSSIRQAPSRISL